jgi:hypothetical protein
LSCSPADSILFKDFEVLWIDEATGSAKDMQDVTLEIYHYEGSEKPTITSPFKEPYIFTETINDQVNIGSILPNENIYIDVHYQLELNLINTNLSDLECPPNNFVVPGTNKKVALVNGFKKYALSACELAALVNLKASGYTACSENGFIVLKSNYEGSEAYLQVGDATWNQTLGLVEGTQFFGQDISKIYDLSATQMSRVSTGNYVFTNFLIRSPPFEKNKRYFVLYKGKDLLTGITEVRQENFLIYDKSKSTGINYSLLSNTDLLSSGISIDYAQMCSIGNYPIGARGPQGFTGTQGILGHTGVQGQTGLQGIQGQTGIQGVQGDTGIQGHTGVQGETGIQGIKGDTGIQGIQGEIGIQGIQGDTGIQGIQGNTGIQGIQGNTGIQGIQGFTGQMGIQGLRGVTGIQGDTGIEGIQGTTGFIGIQGETGIIGVQGIQGDTGIQGYTGQEGIQGATGVSPIFDSLNYSQTQGPSVTVPLAASLPYSVISTTITTNGNPIFVLVTGDAANANASSWARIGLYRDNTAVGKLVQVESDAVSENIPYALQVIDTPPAGTYTYSLKVTSINGGNFVFGEADGPVITATELSNVKGETGVQGIRGDDGIQGITGIAGVAGSTGNQGIQGVTGLFVESELALLKVKPSTGLTIPGNSSSNMFLNFDILLEETSSSVITRHTDTRYIKILESGLYAISIDRNYHREYWNSFAIYKDLAFTPLINQTNLSFSREESHFYVERLNSGDFISMEIAGYAGTGGTEIFGQNTVFSIFKLDGVSVRGETGIQGLTGIQGNIGIQGETGIQGIQGFTGIAPANTVTKYSGSWTVATGTNNYSFTLDPNGTYMMWVNGNIPNGIIKWNATASISNTNVPVVGNQYAWVYTGATTPIDFTSIPNQFVGTSDTILRSTGIGTTDANVFTFGISNTSGSTQIINYGWIKIS